MERPPALAPELVRDFVIAGHGNLEKVKEMLGQEPTLINAAWDWGGGDWETALGGAAHVGNREIAQYLLANGSRFDLYAAAMLGELTLVKQALAIFPNLAHTPGPHGIPLLAHAQRGGEQARPVAEYLLTCQ